MYISANRNPKIEVIGIGSCTLRLPITSILGFRLAEIYTDRGQTFFGGAWNFFFAGVRELLGR